MKNPKEIFLATKNKGKAQEIQAFLQEFGVQIVTHDYPEIEESGHSFEDNALLKAKACAKFSNLPTLADDSGLCIWALGGSPGIFSKRWVGPNNSYPQAFEKIEAELKRTEGRNRLASFICSLAYCWIQEGVLHQEIFEGRIDGEIVFPARGHNNFGYDPLFLPQGCDQTFGEMSSKEKQHRSHRTLALKHFSDIVFTP